MARPAGNHRLARKRHGIVNPDNDEYGRLYMTTRKRPAGGPARRCPPFPPAGRHGGVSLVVGRYRHHQCDAGQRVGAHHEIGIPWRSGPSG